MASKHQIPHIKRHTAGTSNELSFDVLDAARDELDGKKGGSLFGGRSQKGIVQKSGDGKSMSFLFDGIEGVPEKKGGKTRPLESGTSFQASMSTLGAQEEVTRRKKARRAHNIRIRVIAVLAILLVAVGVGTYVYHVIQEQRAFDEKFAELAARFTAIDADVVAADALMGDLFGEDAATARAQMLSNLPRTRNNLAVARTQAEHLQEDAKASRDVMAMGQMTLAIAAREDMMSVAQQAAQLADQVDKSVASANTAWSEAIAADQAARAAAQLANEANTDENIQAAKDATDEALEDFETALYDFKYLENSLPGLDLTAQKAYAEKKIEALGYASATSQALIESNREAAMENNDAYNRADVEAAQIAETLPMSLEPMVRELYRAELERLGDSYDEARTRAIEADAVIRDYLG